MTDPHEEEAREALAATVAKEQWGEGRAVPFDSLSAEARDMLVGVAKAAIDAASDRVLVALRAHWLTGIHCRAADGTSPHVDGEPGTDFAACFCATWRSDPLPSVGAAVEAWISHLFAVAFSKRHSDTLDARRAG